MSNFPLLMKWQEFEWQASKDVYVYDFIHDINDTFQSLALCWAPSSASWLTIPVPHLKPNIESKKLLTEETN